jgi:hypothetical protein
VSVQVNKSYMSQLLDRLTVITGSTSLPHKTMRSDVMSVAREALKLHNKVVAERDRLRDDVGNLTRALELGSDALRVVGKEIERLRAENESMTAIVDRLPKYQDTGDPIMDGDEVWSAIRSLRGEPRSVGLSWWHSGETDEPHDPTGENGFQIETGKGYFKYHDAAAAALEGDSA